MRFKFHYDDNESGEEIPSNPCDNAQPVAGVTGRLPCPGPYFATINHTGTIVDPGVARFNFVSPVPGFPVSFNVRFSAFGNLNLYAPDGVTLLATSSDNDANGVDIGTNSADQLVYTFPDAQTYVIEVASDGANTNFLLTISPGAFGFTSNPQSGIGGSQWNMIYVPATKRIFILTGITDNSGNTPDVYLIVLDSTTMNIVASTLIQTGGAFTFTPVLRILFYNPHDASVWFFQRNTGTGATTFLNRADPVSGAIIEHAAWGPIASLSVQGGYSPADNIIYSAGNTIPTTILQVFSCATRTFGANITIPSQLSDGGFAFDPIGGASYYVGNNGGNTNNRLLTLQGGVATNTILFNGFFNIHGFYLLFRNGLLYGTNGQLGALETIDPTIGTVTTIATRGQYRLDQIAIDQCQNCLALAMSGNGSSGGVTEGAAFAVRLNFDGTYRESDAIFFGVIPPNIPDTQFWCCCLWNPDTNRVIVSINQKVFSY